MSPATVNLKTTEIRRNNGYIPHEMKRLIQYLTLALLLACSPMISASETIDWEQLVPELDQSLDPYSDMPSDLQWAVMRLVHIRQMKANGKGNEKIDRLELGYSDKLTKGGYDLDTVLREKAEFEQLEQANEYRMVEGLNGTEVRIAGYLLPTEFSGDKVTEFLLVPTAGACIHTPPPPANQLVHVRLEKGFENKDLYTPVWVSGRISTGIIEESVSYRDGETSIEAGYSMNASSVQLYQN